MTREQAEAMGRVLDPHQCGNDIAVGALRQAFDDIMCIEQAIENGASPTITGSALNSLAWRLKAAAELAGAIELVLDAGDSKHESEVRS